MVVHVRLNEPLGTRKNILGCAVLTSDAVKTFNNILELEKERVETKKHVSNLIKSLNSDLQLLTKQLPKLPRGMGDEEIEHRELPRKVDKKDLEKRKIENPEKLRKELSSIRKRIERLGKIFPEGNDLFS